MSDDDATSLSFGEKIEVFTAYIDEGALSRSTVVTILGEPDVQTAEERVGLPRMEEQCDFQNPDFDDYGFDTEIGRESFEERLETQKRMKEWNEQQIDQGVEDVCNLDFPSVEEVKEAFRNGGEEGDFEIDEQYIEEHDGYVIINGVNDETYPCGLDVFRETYTVLNDDTTS